MIEMRWAVDERSDAHPVLQYRLLGEPYTSYGISTTGTYPAMRRDWSEWQTVPTEALPTTTGERK